MKPSGRIIAGLALASLLFAVPAANAQDATTQVGNATVSVGVGTAILTLPDVPSLLLRSVNAPNSALLTTYKSSDDFGDSYGLNLSGSVKVPTGAAHSLALSGFWATIDDNGSATCVSGVGNRCTIVGLVDNPAVSESNGIGNITWNSRAEREVDYWGVSLESTWGRTPGVMGVMQAPPRRTVALGADIRGIDQDLHENITGPGFGFPFTGMYREDLDTRYYGAYAAWGGDYLPFLLKGLWERLGLQSSFLLRGGIYYADAEYDGRFVTAGGSENEVPTTSSLSLSSDDIAFIGGLVLETRKVIGPRMMLSLNSAYEYYSWVPEMAYNQQDRNGVNLAHPNGQAGTVINDDDAFSMRTSLRLTIKLGPDSVFEEPLK